MDTEETDRFVDELLDAALERRRSAEPRGGLEQRIAAYLRARPHLKPWVGRRELARAVAATAAALAITAGTLYRPRRRAAPASLTLPVVTRRPEALITPSLPGAVVPSRLARHVRRAPAHPARRPTPPEPRLEQFPTPMPLSEQEKLLLKYVQSAPEPILLAEIVPHGAQPLKIDDLTIPELEIKELPGEENGETK